MIERALISALLIAVLVLGYLFLKKAQRRVGKIGDSTIALKPGLPAIVYFWSPSCHVCLTAQKPTLAKLVERLGEARLQVVTIDVTENLEAAKQFRVMTVPTTFVLGPRGDVRHVNNGLADLGKLIAQVEGATD